MKNPLATPFKLLQHPHFNTLNFFDLHSMISPTYSPKAINNEHSLIYVSTDAKSSISTSSVGIFFSNFVVPLYHCALESHFYIT